MLLAWLALAIPAARASAQPIVTPAATWRPASGFLANFHAQCDGRHGVEFDACFAAAMAAAGASKTALDFTRRIDNEGYLQALTPTGGPIAVAHVVYPFRANENDAWLLVNGTPPLIDVDDRDYLALDRFAAAPAYAVIRERYPDVDFWPGDRGSLGPQIRQLGLEVIVGYVLRDRCHACAIVGRVRFAFDFATNGKLLSTRLVTVTPSGN
jgi:hypothetical protein